MSKKEVLGLSVVALVGYVVLTQQTGVQLPDQAVIPDEQSGYSSSEPASKKNTSQTGWDTAACRAGWFALQPKTAGEYNGKERMHDFVHSEKFPAVICVAQPQSPNTPEWTAGKVHGKNIVTSQVYVLDPENSPCGDDLRLCVDAVKSPTNAEVFADTAAGGYNDGSSGKRKNASGLNLAEYGSQVNLLRLDGSVVSLVHVG